MPQVKAHPPGLIGPAWSGGPRDLKLTRFQIHRRQESAMPASTAKTASKSTIEERAAATLKRLEEKDRGLKQMLKKAYWQKPHFAPHLPCQAR